MMAYCIGIRQKQTSKIMVIYEDGTMKIISEDEVTAEELLEEGAEGSTFFWSGADHRW